MAAFTYVKCTSSYKSFKRPTWPQTIWGAEMNHVQAQFVMLFSLGVTMIHICCCACQLQRPSSISFSPLAFYPMVLLTLITKQTKPYERAGKTGPKNDIVSHVPFCLRSLRAFENKNVSPLFLQVQCHAAKKVLSKLSI